MPRESFRQTILYYIKNIDPRITALSIHWLSEDATALATAAIVDYETGRSHIIDVYPLNNQMALAFAILTRVCEIKNKER